jgi:hypothetical protein
VQDWRVTWGHGAEAALRRIPWRQAARIDAAVQHFARSGEGQVEWVEGSRSDFRLHVPPFVVLIELNAETRVLWVWSFARSG